MCAANEEPNWALDAGVRGGSGTAEISACLSQTSCGHCWQLSVWHPCILVTLSWTHPPPRHSQPWRGSGPPGRNSQRALQKCGQRASQGQDKPKGVVSSQRVHRGTLRGRKVLRGRGQVCFGLRAPGRWEQVGAGREGTPVSGGPRPGRTNLHVGGNQQVPGGPSCHSVSGERAAGCQECSCPPHLVFRKREGVGGREGLMRQYYLPADAGMGAGTSPRAP